MDPTTGRPDMSVMLDRCKTKLEPEDVQEIVSKMPQLKKKIIEQCMLYDNYDFEGIAKACNMKSRDGLKRINQKGYMFLTDPKQITNPIIPPLLTEQEKEDNIECIVTVDEEGFDINLQPEVEAPETPALSMLIVTVNENDISEALPNKRIRKKNKLYE